MKHNCYPNLASTPICSLYCLVSPGSTGEDATWGQSSIRFDRCSCQTLKQRRRTCVLLIVCRCLVIQFHIVPSSSNDWSCYGADYGRVESKQQTIFGYKLHLLVTASGVIVDFELAPASETDLAVGYELLSGHQNKQVIGDKAYISKQVKDLLDQLNRIDLITTPRRNQKQQISKQTKRWINKTRQIVETVNGQLSEQFHIQKNHAHSFWGVCTRLYAKITAHTLCIYLNQLFKKEAFLQIKALAFPAP